MTAVGCIVFVDYLPAQRMAPSPGSYVQSQFTLAPQFVPDSVIATYAFRLAGWEVPAYSNET